MPIDPNLEACFTESLIFSALAASREGVTAFMHEGFILTGQLLNGAASVVIALVHNPGYRSEARGRIREDVTVSTMSPSASLTDLAAMLAPSPAKPAPIRPEDYKFPDSNSPLAVPSSEPVEPPPSPKKRGVMASIVALFRHLFTAMLSLILPRALFLRWFDPEALQVHVAAAPLSDNSVATGLVEDVHLAAAVSVDSAFGALRGSVKEMKTVGFFYGLRSFIRNVFHGTVRVFGTLLRPGAAARAAAAAADAGAEVRSIAKAISVAGYPFERHTVTTEDGHILVLDRIPRKDSTNAVLFVHGILDCSFAWIGAGPLHALAYRAHDVGCDVWLANLRGTRGCEHVRKDLPAYEKWDFNVNHHADYDLPAIVNGLRAVKMQEIIEAQTFPAPGQQRERFPRAARLQRLNAPLSLTCIAHSMGGAAALMYVVGCRLREIPHHFDKMILLSPAGIVPNIPRLGKIVGPIMYFISLFIRRWIYAFRFPSELSRVGVLKIMQDFRGLPALRDLLSVAISGLLLGSGTRAQEFAFSRFPALSYNIFAGTSIAVFQHVFQWYWKKKFLAYDYGAKRNLKEYGSKTPLDYQKHYDKIDIPIHFMCGERDKLIQKEGVLEHYQTLKKYHPNLAYAAVLKMGHLDFTYGISDALIAYVIRQLPSPPTVEEHKRSRSVG